MVMAIVLITGSTREYFCDKAGVQAFLKLCLCLKHSSSWQYRCLRNADYQVYFLEDRVCVQSCPDLENQLG